jgi:hypothetical protein
LSEFSRLVRKNSKSLARTARTQRKHLYLVNTVFPHIVSAETILFKFGDCSQFK